MFNSSPLLCRTILLALLAGGTMLLGATSLDAQDSDEDFTISGLIERFPALAQARDKLSPPQPDEDGALKLIQSAVKGQRDLPPPELILASLYFAQNQGNLGMAALDETAEKYPNDPETYIVLAQVALAQNRKTEAALLIDKAAANLAEFSQDAGRKERLAIALTAARATLAERREDWDDAIKNLKEWVGQRPESPGPRVRLARALFRSKQGNEAVAELEQAYKLNDKLPQPAVQVARFYLEMDDRDMADKWFKHAASKHKDDAVTQLTVADWNWNQGRSADAARYAQAAIKLDGTMVNAKTMAGMIAHYEGELDAAEDLFKAAYDQDEKNLAARNQLALVLAAQSNPIKNSRALELAEQTAREFPGNVTAVSTLGWIQFRLGRYREAAQNLQAVSRSGRVDTNTRYYLARLLKHNKQDEQALQILEPILKSKALFVHRREAQDLYGQLTKQE